MRCRLIPSYFSFAHSPALFYEGVVIFWFYSLIGIPFVRCEFLLRWFAFHLRCLFLSSAVFQEVLLPTFRVFLLPSLTCHFGAFAPSALLLPSCGYCFSFRSSSSSLRIFFLGCPGIHSRGSRWLSLSSPSPTAIRLFPLDRSPLGSLSSLLLSFYPFGVFRRLCLLPLDFALALLFLEFFSSFRLLSLRCYFFVCAVSSAGFYAPHVLSPSLCHLADPDVLRVLALAIPILGA